jgi:DNA-directed RNA polymerase specialized sigma subunit
MQMTTLLNGIDGAPDEVALIQSQPIAVQWTNELRRIIGIHPSCKILRDVLSLDLHTRMVVYLFLIKGWSPRRIANRLKISPSTIQKLLETGREQLKGKLATTARF